MSRNSDILTVAISNIKSIHDDIDIFTEKILPVRLRDEKFAPDNSITPPRTVEDKDGQITRTRDYPMLLVASDDITWKEVFEHPETEVWVDNKKISLTEGDTIIDDMFFSFDMGEGIIEREMALADVNLTLHHYKTLGESKFFGKLINKELGVEENFLAYNFHFPV